MALQDPKLDDDEMVWPPSHWAQPERFASEYPLVTDVLGAPAAKYAPPDDKKKPTADERKGKDEKKKPEPAAEVPIGGAHESPYHPMVPHIPLAGVPPFFVGQSGASAEEAPHPAGPMPEDPYAAPIAPPLQAPGMAPQTLTPPGGPVVAEQAQSQPIGPQPQDPYALPAPPMPDAITGAAAPPPEGAGSPAGASSPAYHQPENPYAIQPSGLDRDTQDLKDFYDRHPEARAEASWTYQHAQQVEAVKRKAELDARDAQQAINDHQATLDAFAKAQRDLDAVVADAQRLANTPITKPEMNAGNLIGILISGAMGGAMGTGRNTAMEQFNHEVETSIETQRANLANQWKGIDTRKNAIAEEYARHGDADRAANAYRLAQYQRGITQIDTAMQQFDPRGQVALGLSGVRQQFVAQQQQALQALQVQRVKDYKTQWDVEKTKAEIAELNAKTAKLGAGSGTGGPGNTAYNTPTGIMSPFLDEAGKPVPLMGTKSLDVKGHEKEFKDAQTSVSTYGHVQDYWADLARLGAETDEARKTLSESAWSKFKTTKGAEYDAARHALVVYLTKELGDKLTQGQIDEQVQRIPERASVFESREPMKQISDAQEQADRDFAREMNTLGVDPAQPIAMAKKLRAARPQPKIVDDVAAAQAALSSAEPGSVGQRDAAAALEAANERRASEIRRKKQDKEAVSEQSTNAELGLVADTLDVEGLPPEVQAQIESHNQAIERQRRELAGLTKLQATKLKTTGALGVDQQTAGNHQAAIEHQAGVARDAERAVHLTLNDSLRSVFDHYDDLSPAKRKEIDALADKHGAPDKEWMRRAWLIRQATSENVSPAFRYGLIKILGGQD